LWGRSVDAICHLKSFVISFVLLGEFDGMHGHLNLHESGKALQRNSDSRSFDRQFIDYCRIGTHWQSLQIDILFEHMLDV
jgi:hypothetical protein